MAVLVVILYIMVVLVALLLIGLILIQPSKSGGLGAAFGGFGESVFGAQAGSHLTKATVFLTSFFFILALSLATLIGRGAQKSDLGRSIDAELKNKAAAEAAVSAAAAPGEEPTVPAPAGEAAEKANSENQ